MTRNARIAVVAVDADEKDLVLISAGLQQRGNIVTSYRMPFESVERTLVQVRVDQLDAMVLLISNESLNRSVTDLVPHGLAAGAYVVGMLLEDVETARLPNSLVRELIDCRGSSDRDPKIDELDHRISEVRSGRESSDRTYHNNEQNDEGALVVLTNDGGDIVFSHAATPALLVLLAQAHSLNRLRAHNRTSEPDVVFGTVLSAFRTVHTPLARWFRNFAERTGVRLGDILTATELSHDSIGAVLHSSSRPSPLKLHATVSVRELVDQASQQAAGAPLDAHHLMAAFIYNPAGHERQLEGWGFDREQWSVSFLGYIRKFHPDEERRCTDRHLTVFSTTPEPDDIDVPEELRDGPSTHIATDRWTTEDTLGYRAYAHAIARFLTHRETKPPLTISIQAPWGGGKTSLMRMIQKELDPEAVPKDDAPSAVRATGKRLTVGQVLQEIDRWTRGDDEQLPQVPEDRRRERLTVWFNAWKYESVNQVWAGLVDAIVRQVTDRMKPAERERFWLQLHFRRVDAEKIRHRVYDRIFGRVRQLTATVLPLTAGLALAGGAVSLAAGLEAWSWIATGGPVAGGMIALAAKFLTEKAKVEKEPADISLGDYVSAPDYGKELGFLHYVENDLRYVFACIPKEYKPLVVFIDDLDRCSPGKVAQVMEAINLFLAGEFPECMFVLGMDSELVAAALQSAHKDLIEQLAEHARTPIGWRFMDKFIQLPFIIPPCEAGTVGRYTGALFAAWPDGARTVDGGNSEGGTTEERSEGRGNRDEHRTVAAQQTDSGSDDEAMFRTIDEGIARFNDNDPEIRALIDGAIPYFRGNPREMKRFVNTFRFHYFLRWAREAQAGADSPTSAQVVRWTVLAMKWPDVARWLRSGFASTSTQVDGQGADVSVRERLAQMEDCARDRNTIGEWERDVRERFHLGDGPVHWLRDGDLFRFFRREAAERDGIRLSSGAGKGLW